MKARQLSEVEAVGKAPQNRLLASTLIDLLDEKRNAALNGTAPDVDALSRKYNIEPQVLGRVTRWVNSPSAGDTIATRTAAREDEEIILTKVSSGSLCFYPSEFTLS